MLGAARLYVCADFATLIGQPTGFFTFPSQGYEVDFMAAGLVVACCVLLIFTTAGGRHVTHLHSTRRSLLSSPSVWYCPALMCFWKSRV